MVQKVVEPESNRFATKEVGGQLASRLQRTFAVFNCGLNDGNQ